MKKFQTPATKADFIARMGSIGKLHVANEAWRDEILTANEGWKDEIIRHFDVVVENIRHDLEGANRDEVELPTHSKSNCEQQFT